MLKEKRSELERDYGVNEIGVIGSHVRGEARAHSDVDILVEFSRPIGFFRFLELEEETRGVAWNEGRLDDKNSIETAYRRTDTRCGSRVVKQDYGDSIEDILRALEMFEVRVSGGRNERPERWMLLRASRFQKPDGSATS